MYGLLAYRKVFFMPGFFLPPDNINAMEHVDGMFNWNSAWSVALHRIIQANKQAFDQSTQNAE